MFFDLSAAPRELYGAVRFVQSKPTLPATQASVLLVPENPDRVFILFTLIANQSYCVWPFTQPTGTNTVGVTIGVSPANLWFSVSYDKDGPVVQHDWYGQSAGASQIQAAVCEVIVDDWDAVKRIRANAPVQARGTRASRPDRQPVAGGKSLSRWADNLSAADQSLHNLIQRRGRNP